MCYCRIIHYAKEHIKHISESGDESSRKHDVDLSNNQQLPQILLDTACYKYDDLIQKSLLLLDRYYTSKIDIFKRALQSRLLLTAQSVNLYDTMEDLYLEMTSYLKAFSGATEVFRIRVKSPIKQLIDYCWLEDEVVGFEPHQINQSILLSFGM